MSGLQLKSSQFRKEREDGWTRLEELINQVESGGIESLDPEDVMALPMLYRGTLSSLSVARAISLDRGLVAYLEALAARAYLTVYSPRRRFFTTLGSFFSDVLPRTAWSLRWEILVAIGLFIVGTLCGMSLVMSDSERFYQLVPSDLAGGRGPHMSTAELREVLYSTGQSGYLAAFSAELFVHNAGLGLGSLALGFLAGVPVMLSLFYNGLIIGAFSAVYADHGLGLELWAWLLPHGVTEILAICLCGGAGLAIGRSIVFPGHYSRMDNLAVRGREAATLVAGSLLLWTIAALVEGIFRQTVQHVGIRLFVATASAVGWYYYFVVFAKRRGS